MTILVIENLAEVSSSLKRLLVYNLATQPSCIIFRCRLRGLSVRLPWMSENEVRNLEGSGKICVSDPTHGFWEGKKVLLVDKVNVELKDISVPLPPTKLV
jgi:hypothetical protein